MLHKIRILHLEDVPTDAELVRDRLSEAPLEFVYKTVATKEDFVKELKAYYPDLILSDFKLPGFTGIDAIKIVSEYNPMIPLIVVTGTLDEETAVDLIQTGAADYVLKENLHRLIPAIINSLEKKRIREEKAQAEKQMIMANERMQYLLFSTSAIIYSAKADSNYAFTFISENIFQMTHFLAKDAVNDPDFWLEHIHPEDRQRVLKESGIILEQGKVTHEYRFQRKDESYVWLRDEKKMIRDLNNEPLEIIGHIVNITERKKAEEELQKSEELYRCVVNSLAEGIVVQAADGSIQACNKRAEEILGLTRDQLTSKTSVDPCWPAIHEDGRPFPGEAQPAMVTLKTAKPCLNVIMGVRKPGGSLSWISINSQPIFNTSKLTPTTVVCSFNDITDQFIAEKSLKNSEQRFRTVFNDAAIGMAIVDFKGHPVRVNPALEKMLGYSADELEKMAFSDFSHKDDIDKDLKLFDNLISGKINHYFLDKRYIKKDGSVIWGSLVASLIRDSEGKPLYAVGMVEEITERVQNEINIRRKDAILQSITFAAEKFLKSRYWKEPIEEVLLRICKAADVSRVYIFKNQLADNGHTLTSQLYEQTAKGVTPQIDNPDLQNLDMDTNGFERWLQCFKRNEPVHGLVSEFPESEQEVLSAQGIQSLIVVPIFVQNKVWGFIGFDECARERIWSTEEMDALITVAITIGSAIERESIEKELVKSKEAYKNIFENSQVGIYRSTPDGKILMANPALVRMLGYASEEELKQRDLVKTGYAEGNSKRQEFKRLLEERGQLKNYEVRWNKKNSEIIIVNENAQVVRDGTGNILYYEGTIENITEKKLAEEELKKSEKRYRKFFENDISGVYISTPEGKFIDCNPSFVQMLGFESVEELKNINAYTLYPVPEERDKVIELIRNNSRVINYEVQLKQRDGNLVYGIENIIGVFDSNGELKQLFGYLFDITERKKIEEQLLQSQKLEGIGQLAGGIAHDFNNLLTVINGYSDILLMQISNDENLRKVIEQIKSAGERAASLTSQLLAFSRRQIIQPQIINPNVSIKNMEKMINRLIGEDIKIRTILNEDTGNIRIDPGQLDQVIMNLTVNARDAMPNGGNLTIETINVYLDEDYVNHHISVTPGEYVLLSISDTGHGMDEKTKARIFEPFFTTKELGKGTGLGLATVYGIVKQAGGNIWVYSEVGKGTTFKLYFPVVKDAARVPKEKVFSKDFYRGSETILIVEDDPAIRELTCTFLTNYGYNVIEAKHVDHAIKIAKTIEKRLQLLITDVVMPKLSGRQLSKKIIAQHPEIKVLFVTGYTDNAIVHHGILDAGVNLLTKPFSPNDLARKVREILDGN